MSSPPHDGDELAAIYRARFEGQSSYRTAVWRILIRHIFSQWIHPSHSVLDLGAGRGEFINNVPARRKLAMDLNPDTQSLLNPDVALISQDCSTPWSISPGSLDVVFTSNFFEHLRDKMALRRTIDEAFQALRHQGLLIAMGPNIRLTPGCYWDFWDHYLPLTERSLSELGELAGFKVERSLAATLPYSMSQGMKPPLWMVRLYCHMPWLWHFVGKQFIVVLRKP